MLKLDPKKMCDQLLMTKKNDSFWGQVKAHDLLCKFDTTLEKAVKIAERKIDL